MIHVDVAKVDQDAAYVAMIVHVKATSNLEWREYLSKI
jgi:hypothetical protein